MTSGLSSIKSIGVFRALQLGDMICAVPALRSLRFAFPNAEIVLIGLPWAESFVKRFDKYIDRFMHFPGYPGLPEQPHNESAYAAFLENVRQRRFDLVIQMQGNGTIVNDMITSWNARHVAGFCNDQSFVDSELFVEYPEGVPEIHRHLVLMRRLGVVPIGDYLEFPPMPNDKLEFDRLQLGLPEHRYVCVHPGSRGTWRQWPPELFAHLADRCAERGFTVVLTGTQSEAEITGKVKARMKYDSIDLTGATTIGAMALLLRGARLLISNCTGVSHLAAALQTPSVVLSMDGEPERWKPLNSHLHKTIDCHTNNCYHQALRAVEGMFTPAPRYAFALDN